MAASALLLNFAHKGSVSSESSPVLPYPPYPPPLKILPMEGSSDSQSSKK